MLTINVRTPWGIVILLMCVFLFSRCRGGQALEIKEEALFSVMSSSSAFPDPSVQTSLVALSASPSPSLPQVAVEMPPGASSPPEHTTPDYAQLPIETRRRIYIEAVLRNELRDLAFGKQAWAQHFGDVGEEPPLPRRIINTLDGPCPFWEGQKVKDTHLLVLIPATVDGEQLTLNKLGELIKLKQEFSNNNYGYLHYSSFAQAQFGNAPLLEASYWLLMTRDVLPDSRNQRYVDQQAIVNGYSNHGYRLPYALEVATCIFAHYTRSGERRERLLGDNPWTYSRCTATQLVDGRWPLHIGGFGATGLSVFGNFIVSCSYGVVCCQRL